MNVRLSNTEKIRVLNGADLFEIMSRVLRRSEKIDQKKEHFWVVGLDVTQEILFIELISLGTSKSTHSDPMEIFSLALSKKAYQLVLVHTHPSGTLRPSDNDKSTTHRMIHIGRFLNVPVWDHLIITESSYYSFLDSGLIDQLEADMSNAPDALTAEILKRETAEMNHVRTTANIVIKLYERNTPKDQIAEITGVNISEIEKIINDFEGGELDDV